MICVPLTKTGVKGLSSDRFITTITTGLLSLVPTEDSQLKKMKNQKARREKAGAKQEPQEDDGVPE